MHFKRLAVQCPWRWERAADSVSMCSIQRVQPDGTAQGYLRCLPRNCGAFAMTVLGVTGIPVPAVRKFLKQDESGTVSFEDA